MSNFICEAVESHGFTLEVGIDEQPDDFCDPMQQDRIGTLVTWHKRYDLGDRQIRSHEELEDLIPEDAIQLPVYIYDHSGITISTSPFGCPWDSGQVGVIFCSRARAREEFGEGAFETAAIAAMESEIKNYNAYLTGEVYYYQVKDPEGNHLDSCYGFVGDKEYCLEQGREALNSAVENGAFMPGL